MNEGFSIEKLAELDRRHVWHPFTPMRQWCEAEPLMITEGKDCYLKASDGRWYLDGVSSIWVNVHGHRRAEIDEAVKNQLDRLAHSTLLGLGSEAPSLLSERLAALLERQLGGGEGEKLDRFFFSDNGSTAVEVALKMAFQYWRNVGEGQRNKFLYLSNAYHGDTMGAMSVSGLDLFHEVFSPLMFPGHRAPCPHCYRCELGLERSTCGMECLSRVEEILREHGSEIAAVIVEPLVQGAAGMLTAVEGHLRGLRELCDRYGTFLIADEVATGFGRTGRMFACEHEGVRPDFLCVAKGITGGYLPLAVTATSGRVFEAFCGEVEELKTLFHGHSYTGNALGSAAAIATLDIFEKDRTIENLGSRLDMLDAWRKEVEKSHEHVGEARGRGFMTGVELVRDRETKEPYPYGERMGHQVAERIRKEGVIIRPIGNVLVLMPPLVIPEETLETMLDIVSEAIAEVTGGA